MIFTLRRLAWLSVGMLFAVVQALPAAHAHETRPAYLEVKETTPGQFSVL